MGLGRPRASGQHFMMREKMFAIGDDYWIENSNGERVFKVDGKAARMRETFLLKDDHGVELAKIQEKKLSIRDRMTIERGDFKATVHKRLIGIRDHYVIDVDGDQNMKAHGNITDHEYEIERDGDTIATVSRKWFRVRDSYGVEVSEGEDAALMLAITVCVDSMARG